MWKSYYICSLYKYYLMAIIIKITPIKTYPSNSAMPNYQKIYYYRCYIRFVPKPYISGNTKSTSIQYYILLLSKPNYPANTARAFAVSPML